jgi:hypothetical protein
MSTVADIPKTKKKRRKWAPISVARLIVLLYCRKRIMIDDSYRGRKSGSCGSANTFAESESFRVITVNVDANKRERKKLRDQLICTIDPNATATSFEVKIAV